MILSVLQLWVGTLWFRNQPSSATADQAAPAVRGPTHRHGPLRSLWNGQNRVLSSSGIAGKRRCSFAATPICSEKRRQPLLRAMTGEVPVQACLATQSCSTDAGWRQAGVEPCPKVQIVCSTRHRPH
jgi:hypothetical protein